MFTAAIVWLLILSGTVMVKSCISDEKPKEDNRPS